MKPNDENRTADLVQRDLRLPLLDESSEVVSGGRRRAKKAFAFLAFGCVLAVLLLWFTVTSSGPLVPQRGAPTATQVGAGRDAYRQLKAAKGNKAGSWIVLGDAQLSGLSALASHGFRPDRFNLRIYGAEFRAEASLRLPMGRWLNVRARAEGPSAGFPRTRLQIGIWDLSPFLSRIALEAGRWILHLHHADVPPLDAIVRDFSVEHGTVTALIRASSKSGLIDEVAGAVALPVNAGQVIQIYCSLTARQRRQPSSDFAEQVRRGFSIAPDGTPRALFNASAFIALGMVLVDERVGDFAHLSAAGLGNCRMRPIAVQIYGRSDWPKHWALSAALAVGAGTQLSEAAGEWKELSDGLARNSQFAIGDPSGFSMADLAADRAGFETARAAIQSDRAAAIAARLTRVSSQQLLPHETIEREDGLSNAEFVRKYGGIDDPRFHARMAEIDAALTKSGLR